MSEKDYSSLVVLMGATEEKIFKSLGKPSRSLNSVKFYRGKTGSTLAIVFHAPEDKIVVKALVLFSEAGEILHSRNITLLDEETVNEAMNAATFDEAKKVLNPPTTDIGSGQEIFAYFTKRAQLITLLHSSEEKNFKLTSFQLTGEQTDI